MRIKIAQYIDVYVPDNATDDQIYEGVNEFLAPEGQNRKNLDFVIEEVNDEIDHPLVDETVGV